MKLLHIVHNYINIEFDEGEMTSFVVCFCEEGDVLGQWRGYADNGKDGAIGFSYEELKQYCDLLDGVIALKKVQYIRRENLPIIIEEKAKEILPNLQKDMALMLKNISVEKT